MQPFTLLFQIFLSQTNNFWQIIQIIGDVRTVDVTIRRLREKIEDTPSRPEYILTRRGVGYYMKNNDWRY